MIREVRPDVVLGHDPWQPYRLHPDHREAGPADASAAIVAARDPHFFAEQALAPHRPDTLLLFEPARVDHLERVERHVDRKVDALLAHRSQWRSTMAIDDADAAPRADQRAAFVAGLHDEARTDGPASRRCAPPKPSPASTTCSQAQIGGRRAAVPNAKGPGSVRSGPLDFAVFRLSPASWRCACAPYA